MFFSFSLSASFTSLFYLPPHVSSLLPQIFCCRFPAECSWLSCCINIQQVKEHDKCPPNQTKEEEKGSLPEKEFRIMIVKMIQNLENTVELQINRLETRIEKMQEMLDKDLEEF